MRRSEVNEEGPILYLRSVMVHWAEVHNQLRIHLPFQLRSVATIATQNSSACDAASTKPLASTTVYFFAQARPSKDSHPASRHRVISRPNMGLLTICRAVFRTRPPFSPRLEVHSDNDPTREKFQLSRKSSRRVMPNHKSSPVRCLSAVPKSAGQGSSRVNC